MCILLYVYDMKSGILTSWSGDTGQLLISCWLYNLIKKEGKVFAPAVTKAHSWFPLISNLDIARFDLGMVDYTG